jgi:Fur family transcriptional regulator, ferric uptake regulator
MIVDMPRPSPVTDVVKSLFVGHVRHAWSLDELHEAAREALGGADYSTVFRAVSAMEREGSIRRVDLGDGKAHYEVGDDHHEHVRCESCGRVAEVPGCVLEDASAGVQSRTGFKVTSHHLVFTGLCPSCAPPSLLPEPSI